MGRNSGSGGGAGGRSRAAATSAAFASGSDAEFSASALDVANSIFERDAGRAAAAVRAESARTSAGVSESIGVFGTNKVFIAAAFDEATRRGFRGTLDDFKRQLVSAHRAGRLNLSRADLVEAMNPKMVRRSEIDKEGLGDGSTFHFIRVR